MDRFCIITNNTKDPGYAVTQKIEAYLTDHGRTCTRCANIWDPVNHLYYTDPSGIPEGTEGVIVLGGDGTLMRAARNIVDLQIPIIGINLGTLGYLAAIDLPSIKSALNSLIADEYTVEKRMMLQGKAFHEGKKTGEGIALNDIVISRDKGLHVISVRNYVNGSYLNSYRADGVILSTPTGSTGYSLSAGGPIISPEARLLLLTPLAAHTLNTRSIVLPSDNVVTVEIGEGRDGKIEHTIAYFDGLAPCPMETGDRIEISRFDRDSLFIKIHNDSFLETLRRKMTV